MLGITKNLYKIRIYGLAMGFGTGHLSLLSWLACATNGSQALVDSISDVKIQSRAYLDSLSAIHALNMRYIPLDERPISW